MLHINQHKKLSAAVVVLLGGLLSAWLFRYEAPRSTPAVRRSGGRLMLRRQTTLPAVAPLSSWQTGNVGVYNPTVGSIEPLDREVTVVKVMDHAQLPPKLSREYPGTAGTSGWGTQMGMIPSCIARPDGSMRTHKVIDGDSLDTLAKRYLNDAARAAEIYQTNRDVLSSPLVLPIGVELKIPPRDNQRPVVPVCR